MEITFSQQRNGSVHQDLIGADDAGGSLARDRDVVGASFDDVASAVACLVYILIEIETTMVCPSSAVLYGTMDDADEMVLVSAKLQGDSDPARCSSTPCLSSLEPDRA